MKKKKKKMEALWNCPNFASGRHRFAVMGRTYQGWQYLMICRGCHFNWYPDIETFGAVRQAPGLMRYKRVSKNTQP